MSIIFRNILRIKAELDRLRPHGNLEYPIDPIRTALTNLGYADEIYFREIAVDELVPLWGRFKKSSESRHPYDTNPLIIVRIDYAAHLNYCRRRFVIVKEMCHSFIGGREAYAADRPELERLVRGLSAPSALRKNIELASPALLSEVLAELTAAELLAPVEDRERLLPKMKAKEIDRMAVAEMFKIPFFLVGLLFSEEFIDYINAAFADCKEEDQTES